MPDELLHPLAREGSQKEDAKANQDASNEVLRKPKGSSKNNLAHSTVARLSHMLSVALLWSHVSCLLEHEATGATPNRAQATKKSADLRIVLMGQNLKLREQDGVSFSSFPPHPVLKPRKGSVGTALPTDVTSNFFRPSLVSLVSTTAEASCRVLTLCKMLLQ